MAGVDQTLLPQMQRDGVAVPRVIAEQPKLQFNLLLYLEAFYDLDTERAHGEALVRIPWSRIVKYGEYHGMDIEELVYFIRKMDDELLLHLANQRSQGLANGGSTGTRTVVQRPPRPD